MNSSNQNTPNSLLFLVGLFLLGFIAAQRFTLGPIMPYICIVPLAFSLNFFSKNQALKNSFLIISLLLLLEASHVENGVTPSWLRYLVILTCIQSLFKNTTIRQQRVIPFLILLLIYLFNTVIRLDGLSLIQFRRDIFIAVLLSILFILKSRTPFEINIRLVVVCFSGYIASEVVNFTVLEQKWYGDYLNLNPSKFLIILPTFWAIFSRKYLISFILITLTFPVLVGYTTRLLLFGYILGLGWSFLILYRAKSTRKLLVFGAIFCLTVTALTIYQTSVIKTMEVLGFDSRKSLYSFLLLAEHGFEAGETLDPVRLAESKLYFKQDLTEVLFGCGFGSGIYDKKQTMRFVGAGSTAFGIEELNSSRFYNFHDIWVDIGLRFGLVPLAAFFYWLIKQKPPRKHIAIAFWITSIIGVVTGFYAMAPLVATFMMIRTVTTTRTDAPNRSTNLNVR